MSVPTTDELFVKLSLKGTTTKRLLRSAYLIAFLSMTSNIALAVCDAELSNAINMTDQKTPDNQMGANWYRYNHEQSIKNPRGSADAVSLTRGIKTSEEGIARGRIVSDNFGPARGRAHVSYHQYQLCMYKWRLDFIQSRQNQPPTAIASPSIDNSSASQPQQNQSTQQQSQQAQQQAQQLAAQNQARADQARQGRRKTHEPAAEAHECIAIDNAGSGNFGAFKNTCSYRVNFYTCNYKPRVTQGGFNWSADFDCGRQQHGMHTPGAGVSVAAHNRNTETVHWFACKAPASPVDVSFVQGQGLSGRCN